MRKSAGARPDAAVDSAGSDLQEVRQHFLREVRVPFRGSPSMYFRSPVSYKPSHVLARHSKVRAKVMYVEVAVRFGLPAIGKRVVDEGGDALGQDAQVRARIAKVEVVLSNEPRFRSLNIQLHGDVCSHFPSDAVNRARARPAILRTVDADPAQPSSWHHGCHSCTSIVPHRA